VYIITSMQTVVTH